MARFRRKQSEVVAWQWNGETQGNMEGVCQCETNSEPHLHTAHVTNFAPKGQLVFLSKGDWIIPEQSGPYYYPCKPDVFASTYEPIPSGSDKFKEVSAELDAAIDAELSEHQSIMTDETDTQAAMGHKAHK